MAIERAVIASESSKLISKGSPFLGSKLVSASLFPSFKIATFTSFQLAVTFVGINCVLFFQHPKI